MANFKNLTITDGGFLGLAKGSSAERPQNPVNNQVRYNTEFGTVESYVNSDWQFLNFNDFITENLVFHLDAANHNSHIRHKQVSNILVDPLSWATGSGSFSGYNRNGGASEQNRLYVNSNPWGGTSVTWRTTPGSSSGADGGWNTNYYPVDTSFTYRFSVWVRRYTSGTGGTFYFGLNPNPLQNDNGSEQGNPYFTYTAISNLTQNQWYLVVAHCFFEGYTGGRHPDSGWYENGSKITDKSFGNVGSEDVRWKPGTKSVRHRAYHYYTTNTASGIEFAFPRVDKLDGTEPAIEELLFMGDSELKDSSGNKHDASLNNGVVYSPEHGGVLKFDGSGTVDGTIPGSHIVVDESVTRTDNYPNGCTYNMWFKVDEDAVDRMSILYGSSTIRHLEIFSEQNFFRTEAAIQNGYSFGSGTFPISARGNWVNITIVFANNEPNRPVRWYQNGVLFHTGTLDGGSNPGGEYFSFNRIGRSTGNTTYTYAKSFDGDFGLLSIYSKSLTEAEIMRNFQSVRSRFNV